MLDFSAQSSDLGPKRVSATAPLLPGNVLTVEPDRQFSEWATSVLRSKRPDPRRAIACAASEALALLAEQSTNWIIAIVHLHHDVHHRSELIEELPSLQPNLPTLVWTDNEAPERAIAAFRAGVQAYILKTTSAGDLVRAFCQMLAGESPIAPRIAKRLLPVIKAGASREISVIGGLVAKRSAREAQALNLLMRGCTDKVGGIQLFISPTTADTHVRSIFRKLDIHSRVELRRLLT